MTQLFSIHTLTPWDGLNTSVLTQVKVLSLKSMLKSFPVVQKEFFDDIISKVYNQSHYSYFRCIKRIVGPNNEDYDISNWTFIWAMDDERRTYQFLFQKIKKGEVSQAILAALAPPELAMLIKDHQKGAILRILSLLNDAQKIKFLMILAPRGKSIAEEQQLFQINKEDLNKLRQFNVMKNMPNITGQWFPSHAPKCPICNEIMAELQNYQIGFGRLICPQCGFEKSKIK